MQKGTKQNKTNIGQFAATKTAEKCCPTLQILLVNSSGSAAATSGGQHDWRVSLSNNRTVTQPALSLAHAAHAQLWQNTSRHMRRVMAKRNPQMSVKAQRE